MHVTAEITVRPLLALVHENALQLELQTRVLLAVPPHGELGNIFQMGMLSIKSCVSLVFALFC